ncbi:MAG: glycosyltransferase family 39 protein [Nanoarchaeota archaeon]|nr:glycosyltransferase family 39 protein [Nanoarchaeota archaeon]
MEPVDGKQDMKKVFILLSLIIFLGFLLRVYQLGTESIWTDEAWSLYHSQKPTFGAIVGSVTEVEGAPFGYYLMLHYWIDIFGNSEFSIRFPSVIFGVFLIFLVFKIGSLLFNKKVGMVSAFLCSTAMLQVLYSQEARMYSLFGLLAVISFYNLLKLMKHQKNACFFVLASALMFYVNYMAFFVILFEMLFVFAYKKSFFKRSLKYIWIALALTVPILPQLFLQFSLRHVTCKRPCQAGAFLQF